MSNRNRIVTATAAFPILLTAAACLAPARLNAQAPASAPSAKAYRAPRLPDGKPDFSGVWSYNTATPFERPDRFKGREFLRPDEVEAVEKNRRRNDDDRVKGAPCVVFITNSNCAASVGGPQGGPGGVGDYNAVFLEGDKSKVVATLRTSILVDPKNGKMPPMTPEARAKAAAAKAYQLEHPFDGPENLTLFDRCLTGRAPPYRSGAYNNQLHIVQSPNHVAMTQEHMHDTRVIPVNGQPHGTVGQWMGDAVGHYEGDTLVVETTGFNGRRGSPWGKRDPDKMNVTERWTRTAEDILLYQFTVDDPQNLTAPYSGEMTMRPSEHPVYEYGCHEGNYSLPLILSGARAEERAAAAKK